MNLLSWLQIVCKQIAILRNLFVIYRNFAHNNTPSSHENCCWQRKLLCGPERMLRANSSLKMSRDHDKQQRWKRSWSRIIQKSWGCLLIIFLIICWAVTVRENRQHLIAVLTGCVKGAWRAPGSSSSPMSQITSTIPVHCGRAAQALLSAHTERLCSLSIAFMQGLVPARAHWGNAAQTAHKALWYHFYCTCCYVPKNVLCFMDIAVVSFLLSHFSTGIVILFHCLATFQPEQQNQCLFCWFFLVELGVNACD